MPGSDDDGSWVCLDSNAELDVLSLPESDSDEAGEQDSRVASAVIEALEDAPAPTLQGISLGSLPQFLGGWYLTSLDFSTPGGAPLDPTGVTRVPTSPDAAAAAAPEDTTASLQLNTAQEYLAAAAATTPEEEEASADAADGSKCSEANPTPTADASEAAADSEQHWGKAALLGLLCAAALAVLLLLLCAGAGLYSHARTDSSAGPLYTTAAGLYTYTYTSSGSRQTRLYSSNAAVMGSTAPPQRLYGTPAYITTPHRVLQGLQAHSGPHAGKAAAARAAAMAAAAAKAAAEAAEAGSCACAASREAYNSTSAGSSNSPAAATQGVLPPPLSCNLSAPQHMRLSLWLLHSTARNSTNHVAAARSKLLKGCLPKLAAHNASTCWRVDTPTTATPQHPHPSAPKGLQCALSGTVLGWLSAFELPGFMRPACSLNPAAHRATSQRAAFCNSSCWTPPSHSQFNSTSWTAQLHTNNSSSCSIRSSSNNRALLGQYAQLLGCLAHRLQEAAAALNSTARAALSFGATNATQTAAAHTATTVAAAAAAEAEAAPGHAGAAATIVPPTKPVPQLYRPPLPCLLMGGGLSLFSNRTAGITATARHSAARRSRAAALSSCISSNSSSTCTWFNVTTRHYHRLGLRNGPLRSPKPFARSWALYHMAKWGLQQQQQQAGLLSGLPGLPMLLPSTFVGYPANRSSSRHSGSSALKRLSYYGLTLPMLPPAAAGNSTPPAALVAAAPQQQQQQQPGNVHSLKASSRSSSSRDSGGSAAPLTLPMLPPVSCTAAAVCSREEAEQQAGGLVLPMLPPVPCIACTHPPQPSDEPAVQQPSSWALNTPISSMHQQLEQQQVHTPVMNSASLHKPSAAHSSGSSSKVQTCRAVGSSSSFILVHQLEPITAARAAAAAARSKHGRQYSAGTADDDPVESILQQLDPWRQYSTAVGCADGAAVPLQYLSGPAGSAMAPGLQGPAAAAALCIKNSSWAVAAASKLAAAAEGLKGLLAPVLSSIALPAGRMSAAVAAYRNATGEHACLPPHLLPQSSPQAAGSSNAAAVGSNGSNGSSQGDTATAVGSSSSNGDRAASTSWVGSLITLPMLPPSRHESAAGEVGVTTPGCGEQGAGVVDDDNDGGSGGDGLGSGGSWFEHTLSRNVTPKSARDAAHTNEGPRQPLWLAPSI